MSAPTFRGIPSPASCPEPEALLAYTERTLPHVVRDLMEAHLDRCADCRAVVSAMVRSEPPPPPGPATVVTAPPAFQAASPPGAVAIGTSPVPDRYRVVGLLGAGGMGVVYRAKAVEDGSAVALKVISGKLCDGDRRKRFTREAETCQRLSHPNVVRVFGFGETTDGGLYIAMELLEGMDLGARLDRGPVPTDEIVRVGRAAAAGLGAAHALGIVHRDVKPSNIFLCSDGGVKVLDFGVALSLNGPRLTAKDRVVGTPGYMAFEQVQGMRDEDARTDVWGLGATLYHAVAGHPPFRAPTSTAVFARVARERPDPLPENVPRWLAEVILRALRKDRAKRWASMQELSDALGAAT